MAHLVITSGQLEGRRIEVVKELVIGRENVDVEIEDAELSRRHVAVRPVEGGLEVEDLGLAQRHPRRRHPHRQADARRDGAVLKVGMTTITIELPQAVPASTAGETPRARLRGHRARRAPRAEAPGRAHAGPGRAGPRDGDAPHPTASGGMATASRSAATRRPRASAAARPRRGCGCRRR